MDENKLIIIIFKMYCKYCKECENTNVTWHSDCPTKTFAGGNGISTLHNPYMFLRCTGVFGKYEVHFVTYLFLLLLTARLRKILQINLQKAKEKAETLVHLHTLVLEAKEPFE